MTKVLERTHSGRYILSSREPIYQLLLLLPLLLLYEVAAIVINFDTRFQLRNGADIIVKKALHFFGIKGIFAFVLVTILFVCLLIVVAYKKNKRRINKMYFPGLLLESLFYSLLIGTTSARLTGLVLRCTPYLAVGAATTKAQRLMIGIGAGVYEEIVFRALLITVLLYLLKFLRVDEKYRGVVSVLVSALVFSLFHYVGEFGEGFSITTFVFRTVAGILLSAIYVFRGIGVSAWSHAFYDVLLVFGWL